MRSHTSAEGVAVRHFKNMLPDLLISAVIPTPLIDLPGNKFELPTVEELTKPWISLFSHSPKA